MARKPAAADAGNTATLDPTATPGADDGYTAPATTDYSPSAVFGRTLEALRRGEKPRTGFARKAVPSPELPAGADYAIRAEGIPAGGTVPDMLNLFKSSGAKVTVKSAGDDARVYNGTVSGPDAVSVAADMLNLPKRS